MKKKTIKSKIFAYNVNIQRYLDFSHRSEEAYGEWEESYSNSFVDCSKSTTKYAHVYSPVDIEKTGGYLVWVEYSQGDSFGRGIRSGTEIIALFQKKESAKKLHDLILKWNNEPRDNDGNYKYSQKVLIEKQEITVFCPWSGYFESLDTVHIQKV